MSTQHTIVNTAWGDDSVTIVTDTDYVNATNNNAPIIQIANKVGYLKKQLIDLNIPAGGATPASPGATFDWDWSAVGAMNANILLTTASTTISLLDATVLVPGTYAALRIQQDANGSRAVSFLSSDFKGVLEYSPTLTAGGVDWLLFRARDTAVAELVGFRNNVGA